MSRRLEAVAGVMVLAAATAGSYALFSPAERLPAAGAYAITPVVEKGATAAFYAPIGVTSSCDEYYQIDVLTYPSGQRRLISPERRIPSPAPRIEVRVPLNARDGEAFYQRIIRVPCGTESLIVETPSIPFEIVSRRGESGG